MSIIANTNQTIEFFNISDMSKEYSQDRCTIKNEIINNSKDWSYDLRLGSDIYITSNDIPLKLSEENPYAIIKPGDYALLITYETFKLPNNIMAFTSLRFKYKQKGLLNASGFHVDPNYNGKIIFSVFNAGPTDIILKYKDPIFMIFFQTLNFSSSTTSSSPPKSCTNNNFTDIPIDIITQIKGQSVTLAENNKKIADLESKFKFYAGIAGSVILTLIGIIISDILLK